MPKIIATREAEGGGSQVSDLSKGSKTLSEKQNKNKKGWGYSSNGRLLAWYA
jgi:hypothetical protein